MSCYGCPCNFCLYNCELESYYFTPGEVKNVEDICFCCDECKWFDGDWLGKRSQWREEADKAHRDEAIYRRKNCATETGVISSD